MRTVGQLAVFLLTACSFSGTFAAGPIYSLTDLGVIVDEIGDPLGGDRPAPLGISEAGDVVGLIDNFPAWMPFLWTSDRKMTILPEALYDHVAINNTGLIVSHFFATSALTSVDGTQYISDLKAWDVNDAGQIVGAAGPYNTVPAAIIWTSDAGVQILGELPGASFGSVAFGINNAGRVVGQSDSSEGGRAFLWAPDGGMRDLGVLPGDAFSEAWDINDTDQVVGFSVGPSRQSAFLWTRDGGMQDLGQATYTPGGIDINNAGQIVSSFVSMIDDVEYHNAFLWTQDEGRQNLAELLDGSGAGWQLHYATDINNAGQIVGRGVNPDGVGRAFLLTPIPEPPSLMLAAGAGVCLFGAVLRRRREQH